MVDSQTFQRKATLRKVKKKMFEFNYEKELYIIEEKKTQLKEKNEWMRTKSWTLPTG